MAQLAIAAGCFGQGSDAPPASHDSGDAIYPATASSPEAAPAPGDPEAQITRAYAAIDEGRFDEAAGLLLPIVETRGNQSEVAWAAGFALAYAGQYERALPLLEKARAQVSPARDQDSFTLIGLCHLHLGNTDAALRELEAGVAQFPEHPPLLNLASQAYATLERPDDAQRISGRLREIYAEMAKEEARLERVNAYVVDIREAWKAKRYDDAEALIETIWPDTPHKHRLELLKTKVAIFEASGRRDEAIAARKALAELSRAKESP